MCTVTARFIRCKFPHDSGAFRHKTNIHSLSNNLKNPKTTEHPFRTSHSARTRSYQGFALVLTLSQMNLLAVIAVGLLSLSCISLRASTQGQAMALAVAQANARVFDECVSSPKQTPLLDRLHALVNRLPVQTLDFRHLGYIAASQQPDDDRLRRQFGDALITAAQDIAISSMLPFRYFTLGTIALMTVSNWQCPIAACISRHTWAGMPTAWSRDAPTWSPGPPPP
jgi:hypothetical protein